MQNIRILKLFGTVTLCSIVLCFSPVHATILTFDSIPDYTHLQYYGDNVNSASQGGYSYGVGTEGWTPAVTASFSATDRAIVYSVGYGDLTNVIVSGGGGSSTPPAVRSTTASCSPWSTAGNWRGQTAQGPSQGARRHEDRNRWVACGDGDPLWGGRRLGSPRDRCRARRLRAFGTGRRPFGERPHRLLLRPG